MHPPFPLVTLALALFASLTAAPALAATQIYPSAAPCDTTLQACIDAAAPGDTIELHFDGSNAETLDIQKSMTLLPASGRTPSLGLVIVFAETQTVDVTLQSLTFDGRLIGVLGPGGADLKMQVLGNTFATASTTAIELRTSINDGTYGSLMVTVEGNRLGVTGGDSCSDGISVAQYKPSEGTSEIVLRGNEVTANNLNQCGGITVYQSDGRMNLTVNHNQVHGSNFNNGILVRSMGGEMQAGVYNNLVYGQAGNVGASGALVVYADGPGNVTAHLVNNTVANNATGMWVGARTDLGAQIRGTMRNNIAAFNARYGMNYQLDLAPGFVESHNLLYGNGEPEEAMPTEPYRRTGNPTFVNAAAGNYQLTASSDAVNRGLSSALPPAFNQDLGGAARIVGSAIDIGAYEYPLVVPAAPNRSGTTAIPTLGQWGLILLCSLIGLTGTRRRR